MNWTWLGSSPTEIDLQEKRSRTQLGRCVAPIFVGGFPTAPKNGQLKTTKQAAPINYRLTTRGWRYKMYFDRVENCFFFHFYRVDDGLVSLRKLRERERKKKQSVLA
jgi:hypothetical protein